MKSPRRLCKGISFPGKRLATFALLSISSLVVAAGCRSTPRPPNYQPPSILEQTVAAMDHEDWETADGLLDTILPELPERDSEEDDAIASNER